MDELPLYKARAIIGNSPEVALHHYVKMTGQDVRDIAAQKAVQHPTAHGGKTVQIAPGQSEKARETRESAALTGMQIPRRGVEPLSPP